VNSLALLQLVAVLAAPSLPPLPAKAKAKLPAPKPAVPPGYDASVKAWHAAGSSEEVERSALGHPKLVLTILNTGERVALEPLTKDGGFSAQELERASQFLRDTRTGNRIAIEPMLLNLVYAIQVHFEAPSLRVVSGYRTPKPGTHSNHGRGRALDFVVPGHRDEDVAKFARERGFVGVGTYPKSGFIHADVREHSYFWVDTSGPGRSKREHGMQQDLASKSDADARARGQVPIGPFTLSSNVEAALAKAQGTTAATSDFHDDEATH
jgi:uncharacterized protein YcbK (DUF882 family)